MISIDGSQGEGGGQILRTSLSLSLLTGTPFRVAHIRAGRARPGLMRQHLAAVNAAATIGHAEVSGATLGSQELEFRPGRVEGGDFRFSIGTAGSSTLVFQTILFPLLGCMGSRVPERPSKVTLEGGTHNSMCPPFDFLKTSFVPLLHKAGADIQLQFHRYGFYPAGGGEFVAVIQPAPKLSPIELVERGNLQATHARAIVSHLNLSIAKRELTVLKERLGWRRECFQAEAIDNSPGPGNVILVELSSPQVSELFTGFGEKGVRAEQVASRVADEVDRYLKQNVPVGEHLADQLLLPMALAGGGAIRTLALSQHSITQMDVIRLFLGVEFLVKTESDDSVLVSFSKGG